MKGSVKRLRPSDVNTKPYKPGNPSPLRDLVFLQGNPRYIRIDPAHTFAIDGVGKSYYASAIVLLMMVGYFGGGTTEAQFRNAYSRFMAFCDANGKSTSIHEFSYKTLKLPIGSLLASIPRKKTINKLYSYVTNLWESFLSTWFQQPRLRGFPQGLGKGHDAAVVGSWLDQELQQIDVASVVTCIHKGFFWQSLQ